MIKEGDTLFYEEDGFIYSGRITHMTDTTFELEDYGCCCEGTSIIDRSMIGYTFFQDREELEKRLNIK